MPSKQHIVWFSWKDIEHPKAGGAEVITDQLLSRSVADGHEAILVCSGFEGGNSETIRNGYKIVRVGNRVTVYYEAWRYYRRNLKNWASFVVDECNTVPFFASWYVGKKPGILLFYMLCRRIWFYELPKPLGLIGYIVEPVYLRLLKRWSVITISASTKQDLIRNGFKAKNITIIHIGINTKPVSSLEKIKKYKEPTLLSFGSVRSMKRTIDQIQAFEIAKRTIKNLELKVVGDYNGSYGAQVIKIISNSIYKKNISLLGQVDADLRSELMRRSHLLLVTSVKEGWGLVVTEAASQGTPSVVYDVDGLRDSVKPSQSGIVTSQNPNAPSH